LSASPCQVVQRHADRAGLAIADPNSRPSIDASAFHAEIGHGVDDHLLEAAQPRMQVAASLGQEDDGIQHDLPRAVPRGLAAAFDGEDRHVHAGGVAGRRLAAQRDDILVLGDEQDVAARAFGPRRDQFLLRAMRLLVARAAQPPHLERGRVRSRGLHFFW
jgi:hypothetical protein